MKTSLKTLVRTTLLAASIVALPALAGGPATTGALATPANRIAGVWSNVASTGPCSGGPASVGRQTVVFSAGGTFLDNPRFPPSGAGAPGAIQQRSIGVGTWDYNPLTGEYHVDQQFDWYLNGAYNGYQTVHRSILLSGDGNTGAGPVHSVRYAADNSIVADLCGSATATRL